MRQFISALSSLSTSQTRAVYFIVIFTFLLLFSLRAVQQVGDSFDYMQRIRSSGSEIFSRGNHLLYAPTVGLCLLAVSSVWKACDVVLVAQIFNILWAIVAVASFFFIMRQSSFSVLISLLAALSLLVSHGFWVCSTQVEPYVPALGCLAAIVAILVAHRDTVLGLREIGIISILLSLSIFYHRGNVWFCVPLGYYLVTTQGEEGWRIGLKTILLAGIVVLSGYILTFLFVRETWSIYEFLNYCLSDVHVHLSPAKKEGTFEHFSVFGMGCLSDSQFRCFVFVPKGVSQTRILAAASFALMISILYAFNVLQVVRHSSHAKIRAFLLIWVFTYFGFFLWAIPAYPKLFIFTAFPILLLAFLSLRDVSEKLAGSNSSQRIVVVVTALFVSFLAVFNLTRAVLPYHTSMGPSYSEAKVLNAFAPPGYVVFTDYDTFQNLRYYFNFNRENKDVIEVHIPILRFYRHLPLFESYHLKSEKGSVVSLAYVAPGLKITDQVREYDGYRQPSEWLAYIEWLFDFEYDSTHRLVACREFKVITINENQYILLSPSRIRVNGLNGLFQMLDSQIGRKGNLFQTWLSTAYRSN